MNVFDKRNAFNKWLEDHKAECDAKTAKLVDEYEGDEMRAEMETDDWAYDEWVKETEE